MDVPPSDKLLVPPFAEGHGLGSRSIAQVPLALDSYHESNCNARSLKNWCVLSKIATLSLCNILETVTIANFATQATMALDSYHEIAWQDASGELLTENLPDPSSVSLASTAPASS